MSDELKPVRCGCGGASNIVKRFSRDYHVPVWYVECIKCNIETDDYFSEAEAVEAWNRAMGATDICVGDNERTAKVAKVDMPSEHNKVYKCLNCGQYTHRTSWSSPVNYCTNCGARLEWNE